MKIIFLVAETPLDLLLLSLFLKNPPRCEIIIGVQRSNNSFLKNLAKAWKVYRNSGLSFVAFNVFIQSKLCMSYFLDDEIVGSDIDTLCKRHGNPLFYFEKINDANTIDMIRKISPDLILNHMSQRIRYPLINLPPRGIVNIHPALLPNYQGMGSNIWPLIDGHPFHGASFHYITSEEIDVGPLIAVVRYPINPGSSALSLNINSRIAGALSINHIINKFIKYKSVEAQPQTGGTYHKLPDKKALGEMTTKGHHYISMIDRNLLNENTQDKFEYCDETTGWEWQPFFK